MNQLVIMKNQKAVTTSLVLAETFEKQHKHVLEAIDNLAVENPAAKILFHEDFYESRGKNYRMVVMNRDGFLLIAMGFNGKRATEFKLAFIDAFNEMELLITKQLDTSNLSPELQFMNSVVQSLTNQELETKRLDTKIDNITEIVALDSNDWRKKTTGILRKIAIAQGGFDKYQEIGNESYMRLENKGKCNLDLRLENRKKNMIAQGLGKSSVKRLNKLDVIASDARLTEIYLAVVKDMAIKYGIHVIEEDTA